MVKVMASRGGNGIADRNCTVQLGTGAFCDAPSMEDAPFPICERHFLQVVKFIMGGPTSQSPIQEASDVERARQRRQSLANVSVVYYLNMGDGKVKIGRSATLVTRVETMHRTLDDVLAVEMGSAKTEKFRHNQFAAERIGKSEIFQISPRLRQHMHELATAKNRLTVTEVLRQQRVTHPSARPLRSPLSSWI